MLPIERQLTSLGDQQPVTRQATSPFDVLLAGEPHHEIQSQPDAEPRSPTRVTGSNHTINALLFQNMKLIGDKRVELSLPGLTLIFNGAESTALFVSGGGVQGARVGERIEVVDWAQNTGIAVNFNGKRCTEGGSLKNTGHVDAKASKSLEKFLNTLTNSTETPVPALLLTFAAFINDLTRLVEWRTTMLIEHLTSANPVFVPPLS